MFCPECGQKLDTDSTFCSNCGANVTNLNEPDINQNTNVSKKAPFDFKKSLKYVIPAAVLLVVALICIIAPPAKTASAVPAAENNYFQANTESETLYFNKANEKFEYEADYINEYVSMNGSMLIALENDGEFKLEILPVKGSALNVAEAAGSYNCAFSDNGKGVLYLKDTTTDSNSQINTGTLTHYYNGKTTVVAEDVLDDALCISPDGRTYAYITDYSNGDFTCYYSVNGGAVKELGENKRPIAISNNARFIYYAVTPSFEDESKLTIYVKSLRDDVELCEIENSSIYVTCMFNADYSEFIYSFDNKSYISVNGKDKQKLGNREMYGLLHRIGSQVRYVSYPFQGFGTVYNTATFAGTAMLTSDSSVVYLNKEYEAVKIASDIENLDITADGKTLIYISDDKLYITEVGVDASEKTEKINVSGEVVTMDMSADGKLLYYINSDDELYCLKGSNYSKSEKIADDVYNVYSFDGNSSNFFFLTDYNEGSGTLFVSKNGGDRKKVEGGAETIKITTNGANTYVYANYDDNLCDLYVIEGIKLKQLTTDIEY